MRRIAKQATSGDRRHRPAAAYATALLGLAVAGLALSPMASASARAGERMSGHAAETPDGSSGSMPDERAGEPSARARLWVGVARPDGEGGVRRDWALLTCDPDGGTHPRAAEACDALRALGGDLGAEQVRSGMCTTMYRPVTVTAVGRWDGSRVRYRETFDNACTMRSMTGPVFAITDI